MAEAWDAIAAGYAQRAAPFTGSFAPELLAAAGVGTGDGSGGGACVRSVCDVAAGSGAFALAAAVAAGVHRVSACDISPGMLAELAASAAAALPASAASIDTAVCSATALPYPTGSFDAVVSNFGVIFAPDLPAGLASHRRDYHSAALSSLFGRCCNVR